MVTSETRMECHSTNQEPEPQVSFLGIHLQKLGLGLLFIVTKLFQLQLQAKTQLTV